jgi:hypothetical protein
MRLFRLVNYEKIYIVVASTLQEAYSIAGIPEDSALAESYDLEPGLKASGENCEHLRWDCLSHERQSK